MNEGTELFAFKQEDWGNLLNPLTGHVRRLLTRPNLDPLTVARIAVLLHGLKRLPLPTPGIAMTLTLTNRHDENSMAFWNFTLDCDDGRFRLGTGESIYDPKIGSNQASRDCFEVEVNGDRTAVDVLEFDSWLEGFGAFASDAGTEIDVEDMGDLSRLDWEKTSTESEPYWSQLESDFA